MLKISNIDPGSKVLAEAFAAAEGGASSDIPSPKSSSSIAVLAFLAFISIGPYLLMKLVGNVSKTAIEETRHPKAWINPINAVVQFDFIASNQMELTARAGQNVVVAPRDVQSTHKLLDSGWVLASIDGVNSGLIPVNYIESVRQTKVKEVKQVPAEEIVTAPSNSNEIVPSPLREEQIKTTSGPTEIGPSTTTDSEVVATV